MKRPFTSFIILTFLSLRAILFAGGSSISIDSKVDKSTIKIGDLVTYSVIVTRAPEVQVDMPELAANLGTFEIRDYIVHDPMTVEGKIVDRVDYVISTFDIGEFEIPPLSFYYSKPPDSTKHELKTQKLKIVVESLKPSEAGDIRDVKGPLDLPRDYRKWIIWGSIGFASLVMLSILFYIWRRRKAGKGLLPEKVEPPRPAHEIALEELAALKASSLLAEGKAKQFYIEISEIIRRYIEGRYFIIAMELTTHELIETLKSAHVSSEEIDIIYDFLAKCDMVKFAKHRPSDSENLANIDLAFEIVERTKLIYETGEIESEEDKEEPTSIEEKQVAEPVEEEN
ncbi:MAG: hypothetical protein ACE5G1_03690 [bacterium]